MTMMLVPLSEKASAEKPAEKPAPPQVEKKQD